MINELRCVYAVEKCLDVQKPPSEELIIRCNNILCEYEITIFIY